MPYVARKIGKRSQGIQDIDLSQAYSWSMHCTYDLSQTRKRGRHSANSSPEAHHMIDQPIVRGNGAV